MGKILKKGSPEWEAAMKSGQVRAPVDDGPDVSGLNDASGDDMPTLLRVVGDPASETGAVAHKLTQGLTFKGSDELQGAMGVVDEASTMMRQAVGLEDKPDVLADPVTGDAPPEKSIYQRLLDAYRKGTGAERRALDEAQAAHPELSTGAELTGAVLAPVPRVAKLPANASRLSRMGQFAKQGAAVGAAFGAGGSESDSLGGVALDTVKGAGAGGATGAVTGGALHGLLSKLEGKERAAIEKAREMAQSKADKAVASARGSLGGMTQVGSRQTESLQAALDDPSIPEKTKEAIRLLMADPKWGQLRQGVVGNQLEAAPSQLSRIENAQAELAAANAGAMPSAVEKSAQEILGPEALAEQVGRRAKTYASRFLPPTLAGASGALIGGPEGAAFGSLLGMGASAISGAPGTALANMMRHPAVASRVASAAQMPARAGLPAKLVADQAQSLTPEEEQRQRFLRLLSGLKD